jgi:osmotically-inducible protein OsmY
MFRFLFKTLLLFVLLVAGGGYLLGWWGPDSRIDVERSLGTTGAATAERAREVGAKVGEKTAVAADQARRALNEGSLTAKIKAKIALDDSVKALDVDVDTTGTTVTVTGTVGTAAQRQRVLQLARETDGVKEVVDRLQVQR